MMCQNSSSLSEIKVLANKATNCNGYYPFGMQMPGRTSALASYRYGFNGKENDGEVKGEGNSYDFGARIYDPRGVRFLSVDPLTRGFAMLTPYQYASNSPISHIDLDGEEGLWYIYAKSGVYGKTVAKIVNGTEDGVKTSVTNTWNFIRRDAWRGETWKQTGLFLEEAILSTSTVKVAETPRVDASVQSLKDNVINGDAYTRSKFVSQTGTDILTGLVADKGFSKLSKLKWSAELPAGTQVAGVSASKKLARMTYAENVFSNAGKTPSEVVSLMNTIDFSKVVKETILNPGDKVWRFERINSKGGDMHFFTDAYSADAGATGVGFSETSGYKLVTYEVTEKTAVMESTIRGTKNKQFFSTNLQENIKKIGEE